jgi:hypothetical protein
MDTDQLNDEQRYYKEKYFKYKLKYVTLKKQLEGGSSKDYRATANRNANLAWLATPLTKTFEYTKKSNMNWNQIATALQSTDNALYNIISTNNILDKIKNSSKWNLTDAIEEVVDKNFIINTWEYKTILKKYLLTAIK